MQLLHAIYDALSARELASITLLGLSFLLFLLLNKGVRTSVIDIIKLLFHPKILTPILLLYGCIATVCYILYCYGLWNNEYVKDIIFYALTAVPLMMDVVKYKSQQDFGKLVLKQVKLTVFISVYLNVYTFSYWCEILLQLVLCMLVMLVTALERQDCQDNASKLTYGCLNKCIALIGWIIFIFVFYQMLTHPILYSLNMLIQGIAIPLALTIVICPYLYLLTVCSTYETWFMRLKWSVKQNITDYRERKILLLKNCRINLNKIKYFEGHIKLFAIEDNSEFAEIVHRCNIEYKATK